MLNDELKSIKKQVADGKVVIMKICTLIFITMILLSGCANEHSLSERVLVFESRQALQCETTGIDPAESAAKLFNAGITVNKTYCGHKTGVAYPAACGMGNGAIVVHEIAEKDVPAAQQAGFQKASELVNKQQGTGYETVECELAG